MNNHSIKAIIDSAKFIFWDFDGVIKDSIEVKSDAFFKIFQDFGDDFALKVKNHHEDNGGLSRFEKFPLYLDWSGIKTSEKILNNYLEKFASIVKEKVIDSDWVPGVKEKIINKDKKTLYFIVTAVPQDEIEDILKCLGILKFFDEVIGAPVRKEDSIKKIMTQYSINATDSIMIGDSETDYLAAKENSIKFILRQTKYNIYLQDNLDCPKFYNLK